MAWPSGTKASTDNVDNGSDLISNARADIKQNIDNVNNMIDEFDIASPSDGDMLEYDATSGEWKSVSRSAGRMSIWRIPNTLTPDTSGTPYVAFTDDISIDIDNGSTMTKTYNGTDTTVISLTAGTYILEVIGNDTYGQAGGNYDVPVFSFHSIDTASDTNSKFKLEWNNTVGAAIADFNNNVVTFASDIDLYVYYRAGGTNALLAIGNYYFKFTKVV